MRQQGLVAVLITILLLLLVTALDYVSGPRLNLGIAYFLPIIYAVWSLGRAAAVTAAFAAEIPIYLEQMALLRADDQSVLGAISTAVVRLLIYLFVAEVTLQLIKSRENAKQAAEELRVLSQDLQKAYSRLDEDARAGGLLQSSALAVSPPILEKCEVGVKIRYAQAVGGDFADAGVSDNKIYVCVSDISGKGTSAALFTLLLKHLLNSLQKQELPMNELFIALNHELQNVLPHDRFVTMFYAEIDPDSGQVEYINAGHPEALVYRHLTNAIELLEPTAPLLGVGDLSSQTSASALDLQPGDVVALYTDGATESKMPDGGRLGDEVICSLVEKYAHLSAQDMADSIVDELVAVTQEGMRDDLAVVCIKMTG